jgi:flagellar motility protein MotE (MotC chaperone)
MDWHLIASWRDAGVPLNVALRGIDIAMDGYYDRRASRGASKINSLCYCHDAVMEAYAGYLESRVGQAPQDAGTESGACDSPDSNDEEFGRDVILVFLSEKISEIESLLAKQCRCGSPENIERALQRLREIALDVKDGSRPDTEAIERDLGILDSLLCEELRTWISAEEREAWEQEAKKDKILKVYKKQLPKEHYEKMRENFFRDKTRKKFHIGELSLFRI